MMESNAQTEELKAAKESPPKGQERITNNNTEEENVPCHSDSSYYPYETPPWVDDDRANAKDDLFNYALKNTEDAPVKERKGSPLITIVREALNKEAEAGDADYKLAYRFFLENYAHLFKTGKQDGFQWVAAKPWASLLKRSRQSSPPDSVLTPNPQRVKGSKPNQAPEGDAALTACSVLRDRCSITSDKQGKGVRGALTHALAAHRQGVDSPGMRKDRVSSVSRVQRRQAVYLSAFENAARDYREGVLLTLTARPGESGDMIDRIVAVNNSVDPLRKWLRRRGAGDAIVARELTNSGLLHLHVVAFGITDEDIDPRDLIEYWYKKRGHGYIHDIAPVERRIVRDSRQPSGRRWRWVFGDHVMAPTERGRFVASYLGETLCLFRDVAEASPEEIHLNANTDGNWWKVAVFWAIGLAVMSVSDGLRSADRISRRCKRGFNECQLLLHSSSKLMKCIPHQYIVSKRKGSSGAGKGKPPPTVLFRLVNTTPNSSYTRRSVDERLLPPPVGIVVDYAGQWADWYFCSDRALQI